MTLPVANTEGERAFTVLTVFCAEESDESAASTVGQDKLCDLSLFKAHLTNNMVFECIVSEFAKLKSREKAMYSRRIRHE